MGVVSVDARLTDSSHRLGILAGHTLLLSRNALFPWFILVPDTDETEFHHLPLAQQHELLDLVNTIARFIESVYAVDKINIATIGNVVPQLHIHIVGRRRDDAAWPGVVWACEASQSWTSEALAELRQRLVDEPGMAIQFTDE